MDILHFIKSRHDGMRDRLSELEQQDGVKARRATLDGLSQDVQTYLVLEKDYLYPEITGLFPEAETLVQTGLASGSIIGRRTKALVKLLAMPLAEQGGAWPKRLAELKESILKHFDQEERLLMPKLRALLRTEDREDLGQVFLEMEGEFKSGGAPAAPAAANRKRA
jgi:hypothetical protein